MNLNLRQFSSLIMFLVCISCKKKDIEPTTPVTPLPEKNYYAWNQFVMGADLSYVNAVQDAGGQYKDSGSIKDPFLIFRHRGANIVRVRLWHNPTWQASLNGGKIYSNLSDVAKTIRRAKTGVLAVCLDLHYSDTWADPAHQAIPAAWTGLSLNLLSDSVYRYTMATLDHLKSEGLVPEMIQIGNETNTGMLFPTGQVTNNNFTAFAMLLKSGIKAVRDFSITSSIKPQIILHVAQPENASWFTSSLFAAGVTDFDIIGISWYYVWSNVTTLAGLGTYINALKTNYNKKVMIVETAFPWTASGADNYNNVISGASGFATYAVSKEGQLALMKDLVQQVIRSGGRGVIYWEPAWISSNLRDSWGTGSSWENNAFFDFNGNALPVLDFMTAKYQF